MAAVGCWTWTAWPGRSLAISAYDVLNARTSTQSADGSSMSPRRGPATYSSSRRLATSSRSASSAAICLPRRLFTSSTRSPPTSTAASRHGLYNGSGKIGRHASGGPRSQRKPHGPVSSPRACREKRPPRRPIETVSDSARTGRGAQPSAKNGRIPGLQRADRRAERVSPEGVLAEGSSLAANTLFAGVR